MESIDESNSLLRSALSIAKRKGESVNWEAFEKKLEAELLRQHELKQKEKYNE